MRTDEGLTQFTPGTAEVRPVFLRLMVIFSPNVVRIPPHVMIALALTQLALSRLALKKPCSHVFV
jgi:hypothetical protein